MPPTGALLIGSVLLPSSTSVFTTLSRSLPRLLRSIPDGETGPRHFFVMFQLARLPEVMRSAFIQHLPADPPLSPAVVSSTLRDLEAAGFATGYDDAALESYAVFRRLREEGVVEEGVKFQVCLPTIAPVVGVLVHPAFRTAFEPIYERALMKALRRIQDEIPHEDLALQIDLGMDMCFWEDQVLKPWFEDRGYVVEYIARMADQVDEDVDLGIHYCYGDINHKHFYEPSSLAPAIQLHQLVTAATSRSFDWLHYPVPVSAMDKLDHFLAPLSDLRDTLARQRSKLYLGVVQAGDRQGTLRRIEAAEKVVDDFGIATECGWGRSPPDDMESVLQIMGELASPEENVGRGSRRSGAERL